MGRNVVDKSRSSITANKDCLSWLSFYFKILKKVTWSESSYMEVPHSCQLLYVYANLHSPLGVSCSAYVAAYSYQTLLLACEFAQLHDTLGVLFQ